jgi:predicted transcriptional regulator/DNA-binding XRE family transcriptional regulator
MAGLKQADLARDLGISASYLNLIEHNRRRIGGKLLLDIARALGVEPSMLTEGAEAALIAALREAATGAGLPAADLDRADEFAGRFHGWAEVLAKSHARITSLERTVETLNDRLAHDPQLAASVHELLSTAAAIRSTAAILAKEKDISPEWRNRFHINIDTDSRRLAESSKALVTFLDADPADSASASAPMDEVEAFLTDHGYHFPQIETGEGDMDTLLASPRLTTKAARHIARAVLAQVEADARALPLDHLLLGDAPLDPVAIAARLSVPVDLVLRRLAALPDLGAGLVVCDRAGSLLFRKPASGFVIPRYGAACPLWPLFDALGQAGRITRQTLLHLGRGETRFDCIALAHAAGPAEYNAAPLIQATMLILPAPPMADDRAPLVVGASCRICPKSSCPARREPSILADGL